jgi:ATP-binding protein involved in chromosome partitioning
VAARVADMARKGHLRVVGVVENMSAFTCAHGERYALFGSGGGDRLAAELGVPLLAKVPFDLAMAEAGETRGAPALDGDGPATAALAELARLLSTEVVPPFERASGTARLLDAVTAATATGGPTA